MVGIEERYLLLGGMQGSLGEATNPEITIPNALGSYRHYQGGSIYSNHAVPKEAC